ncbi:unnamed protein product [Pleuronectes platessa]|uniref:SET domain-containing protein n=1 Tax=Pleuronectes platessa TaxID=8262 RepID=A0A9N7U4K0_PLEPL|nr:unnamed protein product [Pleuronectes platessa]
MQRRRRINPMDDAKFFAHTGRDKLGLDINYINAFKGRGIFTSAPFEKGDFLCEYRGDLITNEECERRQKIYHDALKVFMFEFRFSGKLWCVDAAKEDGSLGRLVNDDHISPNAKMKYLNVQGKPHLCLFAIRDIVAGEEITYNYGDSDWPWRSKKSGGMSSDVKHGEAPCTAKLSTRTQKRSTHEAPKMMPTRTSAGRPECFNKGIDEDMPQGSPNTTNSQTLDEDDGQIEMTASNLNQTSPVLDHLTRIGQCLKHRLVCATIASLDKCVQCVGPVSSFKWLGYQCKAGTVSSTVDETACPSEVMKLEAIREVALAKIQHLFANVHIPQNVLQDMNNKTVEAVRRWLGLNTHSTRDILFLSHKKGGLGVPNVEWTYTTTRLTHLIRMLNNDDAAVRELARASLLLDLRRRKVPLANTGQENFLGFRRKGNGKLDTQASGYGCRSDWPDLNDLCNRAAVRLKWVKGNSPTAPDASDVVRACGRAKVLFRLLFFHS